MASLRIFAKPLKGKVLAQPSKSMAHRAMICAALAKGETLIDNMVLSDDMQATMGAIRALGAELTLSDSVRFKGRKCLRVRGQGLVTLREKTIDCLESGSTARFIMPITRLTADEVTLVGRGRLVERPFSLYQALFEARGIVYRDNQGRMPITLSGRLVPGEYVLPGNVSSQFISGLLFTLPLLEGDSVIKITERIESEPYIHMTLQVLETFGIQCEFKPAEQVLHIPGGQYYKPVSEYIVEGDWSQAAFFCVLGTLSDEITIEGLNPHSLQGDKVILDILKAMGAQPRVEAERITFKKERLTGMDIDVSQCPDLVPVLSVAASLAEGRTHIKNAARLRIKESDRLATTCRELSALGARIVEEPEGLIIDGVPGLHGGKTHGSGDHRIVMSLAVASAACQEIIDIEGSDAVNKSYPEFWEDFVALGGKVEAYE